MEQVRVLRLASLEPTVQHCSVSKFCLYGSFLHTLLFIYVSKIADRLANHLLIACAV